MWSIRVHRRVEIKVLHTPAPKLQSGVRTPVNKRGRMPTNTILVVDDLSSIRAAMRIALEHAGFTVLEAENGQIALEVARQIAPDLVLLDLRMPVLDGWQTVRALRQDRRTESIPVIAMTAMEVEPAELSSAGFRAHLHKPVTLARLVLEIRRCLAVIDRPPLPRRCSGADRPPRAA